MSGEDTSSADPQALIAYSEAGLRIDAQLEASAARLAAVLDQFAATCREYPLGIDGRVADPMRAHAHRMREHALWVRSVAEQFLQADQGVAPDEGVVMGTLESSTSVAGWSAASKIEAALEHALARLPAALADQLRALLTPENVAALVLILGVWAASQAVGVGEVVDLLLAVGGVIMLGPEAIRAVRELAEFATGALGAQSEADLDQAGGHLATAVAIVGVDGAMALLAHRAGGALGERAPTLTKSPDMVTPEGIRLQVLDAAPPENRFVGRSAWSEDDLAQALASKGGEPTPLERQAALDTLLTEADQKGITIHSDEEAQAYLDWSARVRGENPEDLHAVTLGDDIFIRAELRDNVRILREEMVHVEQQRQGAPSSDLVTLEIEARLELIRNRQRWSLTNDEIRQIIDEIRTMRETGKY
jgi:hypothetical protein